MIYPDSHGTNRPQHLVVGESIMDLIRRPGEAERAAVGGSPLNVAVGLSRLDLQCALWTHIGPDEHGAVISAHLRANKVALLPGSVTEQRTSTAVANIQADGSARYKFDVEWELQPSPEVQPKLIHTGSIAATLEPGASVVRALLSQQRGQATISYDPNVRPQLMGTREQAVGQIESFVALSDIVKASDEDLGWLYPDDEVGAAARRWLALGPAVVVITRGDLGALAVTSSAESVVPSRPVDVVDTIGAGDSFMAGLLAGLDDLELLGRENAGALHTMTSEQLQDLLEFASRCAAITVTRAGADPPDRAAVGSVHKR